MTFGRGHRVPVLSSSGLRTAFGARQAVDRVGFRIDPGEP